MKIGKEIQDKVLYNIDVPCALCGRRENRYGAGTLKVSIDNIGDVCISHLMECTLCGEISIDVIKCDSCGGDCRHLPIVMVPSVTLLKEIVKISRMNEILTSVYKSMGSIALIVEKERNPTAIKPHLESMIEELQKLEAR